MRTLTSKNIFVEFAIIVLCVMMSAILLAYVALYYKAVYEPKQQFVESITERAVSPDSLIFKDVYASFGKVCGKVSGKNFLGVQLQYEEFSGRNGYGMIAGYQPDFSKQKCLGEHPTSSWEEHTGMLKGLAYEFSNNDWWSVVKYHAEMTFR